MAITDYRRYRVGFKFLPHNYAASMIADGEVCISRLDRFRDSAAFKGLVYDEGEGRLSITNTYTKYFGLAKAADGLLPARYPAYSVLDTKDHTENVTIDSGSSYGYCFTTHFLSKSLEWAMNEKYETCVLIVDLFKFMEIVTKYVEPHGLSEPVVGPCIYKLCNDARSVIETDPGPDSTTNELLTFDWKVAFCKPPKYALELEARIVWLNQKAQKEKMFIVAAPEIRELLIPVHFHGITQELLANPASGVPIKCKVLTKSREKLPSFTITYPSEVFCPVVDQHPNEDEPSVGFENDTKIFDGMTIENASAGITLGGPRPTLIRHRFSDIESIEFSHQT